MENLIEKIKETVTFIQSKVSLKPQCGIILGTGLGNLVNEIDIKHQLEYGSIPNFPVSTVESHKGKLIFGYIGKKPIVAMQGRFHFYEGYDMRQVTFPVRVMRYLGIERLFISNAAGGVNVNMEIGDLMILSDHLSQFVPDQPLRGKNHEELGPRFPDMSHPYDKEMIAKGLEIAKKHNIRCHSGVYAIVPGPCLETPAEYKMLFNAGADAVGMSTVPEAIVARHMGLPVFAISVITDIGYPPEKIKEVSLEDVIAAAKIAEPKMTTIMKEMIASS